MVPVWVAVAFWLGYLVQNETGTRWEGSGVYTVEAQKLEYDCPPTPKTREEGKPA